MKNDKKVSMKKQADECRCMAEDECREFNDEAEREAIEEFEQGETARYFRENARYVIGLLVARLEAARKGKPMRPLRTYDAETMARLLTADVYPVYTVKNFDAFLSDEETIKRWKNGDSISKDSLSYATTTAAVQQSQLLDVLVDYVTSAAVYAKHIHSSSLDAWAEIIEIIQCADKYYSIITIKPEEALRIIDLEKSAANRLRLDAIIAELPPYKKAKEPKKARKAK